MDKTGFRTFRVVQKHVESTLITSFYLEPSDDAPVWDVKPGQYITLRVPVAEGHVLKSYSVSSDPSQTCGYRVTVKREAGVDGVPDGVGSCWLHDKVQIGDVIEVAAPRGQFFLDEESQRPVVLLSGGVGLTPMVSMLHRLKNSAREVYFLHACEDGQVHALRDEVLSLCDARRKSLFVYRTPSAQDVSAQAFDASGFIDKACLQHHLPIDDYEVYLCGPTPFMVAMYQLLQEIGILKERIAYEFFGKGGSLDEVEDAEAFVGTAPTEPENIAENTSIGDVEFRQSDASATWDGSVGTLLELAEKAGIDPEFSCREGTCGACECALISGEVEYTQTPLEEPDEGQVLICCARPIGSVVLDI